MLRYLAQHMTHQGDESSTLTISPTHASVIDKICRTDLLAVSFMLSSG